MQSTEGKIKYRNRKIDKKYKIQTIQNEGNTKYRKIKIQEKHIKEKIEYTTKTLQKIQSTYFRKVTWRAGVSGGYLIAYRLTTLQTQRTTISAKLWSDP